MKWQKVSETLFKRYESRDFNDTYKIVRLMGRRTGMTIFNEPPLKLWEKLLVWFFQLIMVAFIIQMAWSAYYYRHDFLKFTYYGLFLANWLNYTIFLLPWINREDKVKELLQWCKDQGKEPAYRSLSEWPENYYEANRLAKFVITLWVVLIICWAGGFCEVFGAILASLYFGKFTLIVPVFATMDDNLNLWTFIVALFETFVYFLSVVTFIGVIFLTFYFTAIYLTFRLNAIEELVKIGSEKITYDNRRFDRNLLKTIVDLQVDAYDTLQDLITRCTFIIICAMYAQALVAVILLVKMPGFSTYTYLLLCFEALMGQTTFFIVSQHLNDKVEDVLECFYSEIPWYKLHPKERKILLIMMGQPAPLLMAAGIYPLTYEGYKDIMCNIYSQCTVLRTMLDLFDF